MTEFFEDEKTQLPSLWRVKAKSYLWLLFFGSVFFVVFFSLRGLLTPKTDLGFMTPEQWSMSAVWLSVFVCTLTFHKVYSALNREIADNNTQLLRQIVYDNRRKTKYYQQMNQRLEEATTMLESYVEQLPTLSFPKISRMEDKT